MASLLKLKNLQKTFAAPMAFTVLKDINLEVKEGEFLSVVGPSGCGKSVLLYLIAGFTKPTAGELLIDGQPITIPGTDRMMVFQDYVLFPWKSVFDNVLFALSKTSLSQAEKNKLVTEYLDLVGLLEFKDWHTHKLSGGMKQRVAIARALVSEPKILLMDEPFSALDSQQRKILRKQLADIWQKTKTTVIFVTHSITEAIYLSDRVCVMTDRPAVIKRIYDIDLPRPRSMTDVNLVKLKEIIEVEITTESFAHSKESLASSQEINMLIDFKL